VKWSSGGKEAGEYKEVYIHTAEEYKKKIRFALVAVDGSGHMVPQDKLEAALDMMVRWIEGKGFD
jgi:cathepsin A (carboxypeptidase C)